ncbi:hypothetical protein [Arthrobacter sp. UYCo732]|uniref:hypothetical protein n=1 Tax=Arthrobacter sp. UYCo732 TaxID=3156336 RepID=UPI0033927AB1
MTSVATESPSSASSFQFTSDSEDYDSPTSGEVAVALIGTALLAVPAAIIGLAVVPFILGARALRDLASR